jgi:hypothetical protein
MNHRYCLARYGVLLAGTDVTGGTLVIVDGFTVGSGLSGADGLNFTLGIVDTLGDVPVEPEG